MIGHSGGVLWLPSICGLPTLRRWGIVGNWQTLRNWIKREGFPEGCLLGPNTRGGLRMRLTVDLPAVAASHDRPLLAAGSSLCPRVSPSRNASQQKIDVASSDGARGLPYLPSCRQSSLIPTNRFCSLTFVNPAPMEQCRCDHPVTLKPKCYVYVRAGCGSLEISERSDALTCSGKCRNSGESQWRAPATEGGSGEPGYSTGERLAGCGCSTPMPPP